MQTHQHIEKDLTVIKHFASDNEKENDNFRELLGSMNSDTVDAMVQRLEKQVSSQIDCTQCGNCCRSLMINVTDAEASKVAGEMQLSRDSFDQKFLEKSQNGMMIINTIPCHFLAGNTCSIYEYRFAGCREFPGLHLPAVNKRLFIIFMHYERCPIIFNVIEGIKSELAF